MSKREHRKREKRRRSGGLTPTGIILARWVVPGPAISSENAHKAFDSLRNSRFTRTAYRPTGPDQRCYVNVRDQIERSGGESVAGWLVTVNTAPQLDVGRNKYAKFSLEAHCVWRKDDRLIEVTEGGHCQFIIDESVESMTNGNLFFCDDLTCAQRMVQKPMPGGMEGRHIVLTVKG